MKSKWNHPHQDQQQPPPPPEESPEDGPEEDNTDDDAPDEESAPPIPEEFMLDPEACAIDPDLLLFSAAKSKSGSSGSRSAEFSDSRGR